MSFAGRGTRKTRLFAFLGEVVSELTGYRRIGTFHLNTAEYRNPTVVLEVYLETTGPNCDIQLYNETDDEIVGSDPFLTSTSATPDRKTGAFTPASGSKTYEIYLRMRTGEAPDQVLCSSVVATVSHDDF